MSTVAQEAQPTVATSIATVAGCRATSQESPHIVRRTIPSLLGQYPIALQLRILYHRNRLHVLWYGQGDELFLTLSAAQYTTLPLQGKERSMAVFIQPNYGMCRSAYPTLEFFAT